MVRQTMITNRFRLASRLFVTLLLALTPGRAEAAPIYITFVWHMHQPIYWPGESLLETAAAGHYSFDLVATHTDRSGPYTGWPRDAIGAARAAGLGRCGAQVSLTGSLAYAAISRSYIRQRGFTFRTRPGRLASSTGP
mgnify:CR=1 FL=1